MKRASTHAAMSRRHVCLFHSKGCLHLLFGFVVSLVKRATASSFGLGSYRGKVDFVLVLKLF